jgi:hypothetical protein
MLVAFDTCSYRTPCKAIMGDRDFSITQKRFQAKTKLLDLYKQQAVQKSSKSSPKTAQNVDVKDTIFEVSETKIPESVSTKLRDALKVSQEEEQKSLVASFLPLGQINDSISEKAKKESTKTQHDIYQEVFIDEINQELLNSTLKADGEVIVVLMRSDRLKSFADMWRDANLDYYATQTKEHKELSKQVSKVEETL